MQFPITIGLRRSHFLDVFVALSALIASGAALAFPRSASIQALILFLVGLAAALAWRQLSPRLSAIRLERSGEVSLLRLSGNDFIFAKVLPGATVHPWLAVVRFRADDGLNYTLMLTVDSLKAADFRHLRVFLRWRADFSGPGDDA